MMWNELYLNSLFGRMFISNRKKSIGIGDKMSPETWQSEKSAVQNWRMCISVNRKFNHFKRSEHFEVRRKPHVSNNCAYKRCLNTFCSRSCQFNFNPLHQSSELLLFSSSSSSFSFFSFPISNEQTALIAINNDCGR